MTKLLAAAFMLIDHVGIAVFPQYEIFRIIGRLAMPIYAYMIARGFHSTVLHHTTGRYVVNLLVMLVISQIPYSMLTSTFKMNIAASWLLSIAALTLLRKRTVNRIILLLLILTASLSGIMEYSFLGIGFTLLFYYTKVIRNRPILRYVLGLAMTVLFVTLGGSSLEAYALYALPVIDVAEMLERKHPSLRIQKLKYFWYAFYPAHMYCLGLVKEILNGAF